MKLKIYLRMLLAAVAALFVATACSDSDDDPGKGGPDKPTEPLTLKLAVADAKDGQAKLTVTPSDQMATYYWSAVKKSIYDGLGSDEAFLEDDMAFIQKDATDNQMTLSAYLQWKTGRGTATYTVTGLEAKTEYYAYVYGINTDGTVTSALVKELFTSGEGGKDPDPGEGGFKVTISDVTASSAIANVVPEDKTSSYWLEMLPTDYYNQTKDQLGPYIEESILYMQEQAQAILGQEFTIAQIIDAFGYVGDQAIDLSESYKISPNTTYYVFVAGVDAEGHVTTSVVVADPFTTEEGSTDAPTITLSTEKGDYDKLNPEHNFVTLLTCSSANAAKAMYYPISKAELDVLLAGGATYETLIKENGLALDTYLNAINGAGLKINTSQCIPGTEYCVIVQVTTAGGVSTTETINATTDGTPSAVTFDINVSNITASGAKATITPSNNTDKYFATIQKGVVAALDDRTLVEALEYTYTQDGSKFEKYLANGEGTVSPTTLAANTEYCVIVFGHDGIGATTVVSKEMFTTTGGGETSDLTFTVDVTGITHNTANITITPSNDTEYYFSWYFKKALIDTFTNDSELMSTIISENMPESGDFTEVCDRGPVKNWKPSGLEAATEYYVVCFGVANGVATTGLTKHAFATTEKQHVTSSLFTELLGDWTANMKDSEGDVTFDVTIAAGVNDATTAKYRADNSLVCLGFGKYTYYTPSFLVENGWTAADADEDYGPKWFLEIAEGDVVTVPANMVNSLHNWSQTTTGPVYLLGCNGSNLHTAGKYFPVEVSADKNTITIKGYTDSEYPGTTFYPSTLYNKSGWKVNFLGKSDLVLTRKTANAVANRVRTSSAAVKSLRYQAGKSTLSVAYGWKGSFSTVLQNQSGSKKPIARIPVKAISEMEIGTVSCKPASASLSAGTIKKGAFMSGTRSKIRSARNK